MTKYDQGLLTTTEINLLLKYLDLLQENQYCHDIDLQVVTIYIMVAHVDSSSFMWAV